MQAEADFEVLAVKCSALSLLTSSADVGKKG